MRTLRLARLAAEAEGLRLRHRAQRLATRVACAIIALGFLAAAVVFGHIAAWYGLRTYWDRPYVALAIGGADLLLAIILTLMAGRSSPGQVELEALAVRQRAMEAAASSIAFSALAMQLLRLFASMLSRRRPGR